jgi:nicotinamidase-related amidase
LASIREGRRSALVVVDTQVGVVQRAWDTTRIIGNIVRVVARARAAGAPVLWVQHHGSELQRGSAEWQLVPELSPGSGEPVVHKQFESSFENTPLDAELARLGASRLVIAGAMTNWCIRATAYGALDRGYDVTLVADAHTTGPLEFEDGFRIEAEAVVRELNTVMRWLTYPGRTCGTATADEVSFDQLDAA